MRRLLFLVALVVVLAPALTLVAGLEAAPAVSSSRTAEPEDARRVRAILRDFRAVTSDEGADRAIRLGPEDVESLAAVAARFAPRLRAAARIETDGLIVTAALPVPLSGASLWWNLRAHVAAPSDRLALSELSLGRLPLPAAAVGPSVGFVADLALGDRIGALLLTAVDRVVVGDGAVLELGVSMTEPERRRVTAAVRKFAMRYGLASDPDTIGRRLGEIGGAPGLNGFGALLARALEGAAGDAEQDAGKAAQALSGALSAVAIACGEPRIAHVAARDGFAETAAAADACAPLRLEGRIDLRRHFAVSAALEAAAAEGHAVIIGEIKELLDASGGGSGFSFDDLAANRAGIRFAKVALAAGPAGWPALAARVEAGAALLPPIEGLAAGLSAEAFAEAYGSLDDPRYAALVAEIDRRLDAMPLYAAPP